MNEHDEHFIEIMNLVAELNITYDEAKKIYEFDKEPEAKRQKPNNYDDINSNLFLISSKHWQTLIDIQSNPILLNEILNTLKTETEKYESGTQLYPLFDYCVGLARDKLKEKQKRIEEFKHQEELRHQEELKHQEERVDQEFQQETLEQRKERIRNAWLKN